MTDPLFSANDVEIVCEDGPVLAVNKPAGLLTQGPPAASDTLELRVKSYLKQKYQKPGNVYLGVPHRLDRWVSGVVVFARNSKAARRLAEQFHQRQVKKVYWALAQGNVNPLAGRWNDWIEKIPDQAKGRIVNEPRPGESSTKSKSATLIYNVLKRDDAWSLLEIELLTGRFHQIRLQASSRNHPLWNDLLYQSDATGLEEGPIGLHARQLTILHPVRYDPLVIEAPLPPHWPDLFS